MKYIFFVIIFATSSHIFGQYDLMSSKSFIFPNEMESGSWKNSISLTLAKLPEDAVEEASSYIHAPLIHYNFLVGLPYGFSAHGNATTNWITLHIALGPKWSYRYKRFSVSLGYNVAYVYGRLFKFGFDSEIIGWLNNPNITLGIAFNKFTLSFKTEATFTTSINQFNDDIEIGTDKKENCRCFGGGFC